VLVETAVPEAQGATEAQALRVALEAMAELETTVVPVVVPEESIAQESVVR
jgi:hypothetical protein